MVTAGFGNTGSLQPGQALPLLGEEAGVLQILGRNPGPMTGPGTNSYLLGRQRCALIDPGPRSPEQLQSFLALLGDRPLDYVLVTHTHGDHSPGAQDLARQTGAELVGLPPPDGPNQDQGFRPARHWQDGDSLEVDGRELLFIHTPGHVSNHLCFYLPDLGLLFTGDHVLQGTTPVILPPDGNMADYLHSLRKLLELPLRHLAPGHGQLMSDPGAEIDRLIAHRLGREEKIIACLGKLGSADVDELVVQAYDDVAEHLLPWAKKTLTAHLLKLEQDGLAHQHSGRWKMLR